VADPFLLHGVACGRCGHAGWMHDPNTGLTTHLDARLRACQTKPPPRPEETQRCQAP